MGVFAEEIMRQIDSREKETFSRIQLLCNIRTKEMSYVVCSLKKACKKTNSKNYERNIFQPKEKHMHTHEVAFSYDKQSPFLFAYTSVCNRLFYINIEGI